MYKAILLLKARSDIEPEEFTRMWLELPWATASESENAPRHLHNRAIPGAMPIENAPPAVFDAIDEFWFADAAAARAYFESWLFLDFWNAHCEGLLASAPLSLAGPAHLLWERDVSQRPEPVKIITLPMRRNGMSTEDFVHHWVHVHSPLGLNGPGTKERLQRLEPCPSDSDAASVTGFPAAPFEGAGTIEFADRKDLQTEFASDHYRNVMAPDEPRFTDPTRSCALMVEPFEITAEK